jgi:hypothetical protein
MLTVDQKTQALLEMFAEEEAQLTPEEALGHGKSN